MKLFTPHSTITPYGLYSCSGEYRSVYFNKFNDLWDIGSKFFIKHEVYFFFLTKVDFRVKLKHPSLRSHLFNKNLSEQTQFINILKRHGHDITYKLLLVDMLLLHRKFFESVNDYFNTTYTNYLGFYFYAGGNPEFFDFNFLLNYVTAILNPCVQLKVVKFPKFLQKKLKKKYDFKIKHIPVGLRRRYVYKRIIVYSNFVNFKKVLDRVYLSLAETFLNPETNPFHKERLNFYKHTLKLYRLGKLNVRAL